MKLVCVLSIALSLTWCAESTESHEAAAAPARAGGELAPLGSSRVPAHTSGPTAPPVSSAPARAPTDGVAAPSSKPPLIRMAELTTRPHRSGYEVAIHEDGRFVEWIDGTTTRVVCEAQLPVDALSVYKQPVFGEEFRRAKLSLPARRTSFENPQGPQSTIELASGAAFELVRWEGALDDAGSAPGLGALPVFFNDLVRSVASLVHNPASLTHSTTRRAMNLLSQGFARCNPARNAYVTFSVDAETGRTHGVSVEGELDLSIGDCIRRVVRAAAFPTMAKPVHSCSPRIAMAHENARRSLPRPTSAAN